MAEVPGRRGGPRSAGPGPAGRGTAGDLQPAVADAEDIPYDKGGELNRAIFKGDTINTPSMLCVEDYLDALAWSEKIGLAGLIERSKANLNVLEEWVGRTDWIDFLAMSEDIRSSTSVCLKITDDRFQALSKDNQAKWIKKIVGQLSSEGVAHDIGSYKDAPPGFRIWCGPTVEESDVRAVVAGLEVACLRRMKDI